MSSPGPLDEDAAPQDPPSPPADAPLPDDSNDNAAPHDERLSPEPAAESEAKPVKSPPPRRWKLRDVAIGVTVLLGLRFLGTLTRFHEAIPPWILLPLGMAIPQLLLLAWPVMLLWWRRQKPLLGWPGLGRLVVEAALGVNLAFALFATVICAGALIKAVWPEFSATPELMQREMVSPGWYITLLFLAGATVLAPVCEEVFFRGFLYDALRSRMPLLLAMLIESAFFGAVHTFGPVHAVGVAILGLVLTALYQWRGSLVAPMFLHGGFNLLQMLALILVKVLIANAPMLGVVCDASSKQCLVKEVVPGSAAQQAGILPGDVIMKVKSTPVHSYTDLSLALAQFRAGDRVRIEVLRNNRVLNLEATLQRRPNPP